MALEPVRNNILFAFEDDFKNNSFNETTESGIVYKSLDNSAGDARWGQVIAVGPDIIDEAIVQGARILIEPLMWTEGFNHDGVKIWQTNEEKVLAVGT